MTSAPIVVHRPSILDGRPVTVHGRGRDEILGTVYSDHDLVVFLEGAGVAELDSILDDLQWVEWRRSRPRVQCCVSSAGTLRPPGRTVGGKDEVAALRWNTHRKLAKQVQATVRDLRIPPLDPKDPLGDLVACSRERLGYSITVVTTENDSIINGALESRPGGGTAIVVPAGTRTPNRHRHLVCRGLARCLCREPGHRTGLIG
ncbi:hypothetical protein [Streptomyces anulatus]|uniref:hypothetical protein n=1 Tax=Streptomyces anulatus TaxID=1892 RepID=UPI0033D43947|nr:hypothetical protein OG536_37110 [Streptomyces anulatus]